MPDEKLNQQIAQEDLAELRVKSQIKSRTDSRDKDLWAFDDEFLTKFLKDKGCESQKFQTAIDLYWRKNLSRRELAAALGMSLDGVKSLIKSIRERAEQFDRTGLDSKNKSVRSGVNREDRAPTRSTSITRDVIIEFLDAHQDAVDFVTAYGELAIDAIQNRITYYWPEPFDPFKDCPVISVKPGWDERTNYERGTRGRPRKEIPATETPVKRKRGRPRKIRTAVPEAAGFPIGLPMAVKTPETISDNAYV